MPIVETLKSLNASPNLVKIGLYRYLYINEVVSAPTYIVRVLTMYVVSLL